MSQVASSAFLVTSFTSVGLILSFLSNVLIAAKFGAGAEMDLYFAAITIPLFVIEIATSTLNYTFIPFFTEYSIKKRDNLWKIVSAVINLIIIVTVVTTVVGVVSSGQIMSFIAPGFGQAQVAGSRIILQILLPLTIFAVLNELFASIYYSKRRFMIPSFNKIIAPVLIIAYILLFHDVLSTKSIVLAMLTAGIVQMFLLLGGMCAKKEMQYSFNLEFRSEGIRELIGLMLPLVIGMIIYRGVPIVDRFFLSKLGEGSISHVGYAQKLIAVLSMILVSGISLSIFPSMSKYAAERNMPAFKGIISKGIKMLLFMGVPIMVFLSVFGRDVIKVVFERRAFTSGDTGAVYIAFVIYLLSLPASMIGTVISQGFYALKRNLLISSLGYVLFPIYVFLCYFLLGRIGYLAVPAAFAVFHNLAIVMTIVIIKKITGGADWHPVLPTLAKIAAGTAMSLAMVYPFYYIAEGAPLVKVLLCACGLAVYYVFSKKVFRMEEAALIDELFGRIKARFGLS
ncbi:MAG: hypothetical protein JW803_03280 [Endomicrobiales bacterium]|nr:hypothetical protein [Endomicrobiales bacterium]